MVKLWEYDFGGTPRECAARVKPLQGAGDGVLAPGARALDTRRFHASVDGCLKDIAAVAAEGAAYIHVRGYGTPSSSGVQITTLR